MYWLKYSGLSISVKLFLCMHWLLCRFSCMYELLQHNCFNTVGMTLIFSSAGHIEGEVRISPLNATGKSARGGRRSVGIASRPWRWWVICIIFRVNPIYCIYLQSMFDLIINKSRCWIIEFLVQRPQSTASLSSPVKVVGEDQLGQL